MSKWYAKGVKFSCTQCGKCCSGGPGVVWITEKDSVEIAQALGISLESFFKTYTRFIHGRRALLEKNGSYECIFLSGSSCSLYKARPRQCKTFPFWSDIMESKASWEAAKIHCEGMNKEDGKHFSQEEIDTILSKENT